MRASWGTQAEFRPTSHAGHATLLAEQAAREGFAIGAAAAGDGTAHEVLNGMMRVRDPAVQFTIIPIGSANDYAFSLGLTQKTPPPPRRVDVGLVRTSLGQIGLFWLLPGTGFNGRVTLESRRIHHLQGVFLYGLAFCALLHHYRTPLMLLRIDDEPAWTTPTLLFSVQRQARRGLRARAKGASRRWLA